VTPVKETENPLARKLCLVLVVLIVFLMPNQLRELTIRFRLEEKQFLPINVCDVLLCAGLLALLLKLAYQGFRNVLLPPAACIAVVIAPALSLYFAPSRLAGAKDVLQNLEYYVVGVAVFANLVSWRRLKTLVAVFVLGTAAVAIWAFCQYAGGVSAMRVSGPLEDRNMLGVFFALSVPFLFGYLLWTECLVCRIGIGLIIVAALVSTLSGGALIGIAVACLFIAALRGRWAFLLTVAAVLVAAGPVSLVLRPYHSRTLRASVAPLLKDNYLLSDAQLFRRARLLDSELDRPEDALRCMNQLRERRTLSQEESDFAERLAEKLEESGREPALWGDALPARRYQRWTAALAAASRNPAVGLLGSGPGSFNLATKQLFSELGIEAPSYRTDEPEVFNLAPDEPNSFNQYLVALVEGGVVGLLAVLWLWLCFIVLGLQTYFEAHSDFGKGTALAIVGALVGTGIAGIFSSAMTRGTGLCLAFVFASLLCLQRIVHGESRN